MIKAFQEGKDIYATIAALSFNMPYEKCLEFDPDTHEYQAEGKARRGEAKTIVLGVTYGRSTVTIGEQLFGDNPNMTEEDRTKSYELIKCTENKLYELGFVIDTDGNLKEL